MCGLTKLGQHKHLITVRIGMVVGIALLLAGCVAVAAPPQRHGVDAGSPLANALPVQHCEVRECWLYAVDVTTGQPVEGIESLRLGSQALYAYAPDLTLLAIMVYAEPNRPQVGNLMLP